MLDATRILLMIHIFVLGAPIIVVSVFLLVETVRIRRFLERYAIQMTLFKGILLVGYLFVFIAAMHLFGEVLEWYGYGVFSLEVGAVWHGSVLVVLAVVSYSFYRYLKSLKAAEKVG